MFVEPGVGNLTEPVSGRRWEHPQIGREFAIKMMTGGFADHPELKERFLREARSPSRCSCAR